MDDSDTMPPGAGGRTVLISGAAGGIGSVTCRRFLTAGFRVLGMDIAEAAVDDPLYTHLNADVTVPDMVDRALAEVGNIDHVVTMAGIALPAESEAQAAGILIGPAAFRASVELNLCGHFNVLHAAVAHMPGEGTDEAAGGTDRSVTFVSSINAVRGFGLPAYSAAKAGLGGLAVALTAHLAQRSIRVNVILPGTVRTPSTEKEWSHDPGHFERFQRGIPLGRLCTPDDVADMLLAIAGSRHVTGQQICVDGGQSTFVVN